MAGNYADNRTHLGLVSTQSEAGQNVDVLNSWTVGTDLEAEGVRHFENGGDRQRTATDSAPLGAGGSEAFHWTLWALT